MSAGSDTTGGSFSYSRFGTGIVVSPVDKFERSVVGRFNAIFHHYITASGQFGEIIEYFIVHTVGTRTDNYTDNFGMRERFFINGFQFV